MSKFAIIGGGVSGTAALYQLVENLLKSSELIAARSTIVWIGEEAEFGTGLAWGEGNADHHIFNQPSNSASIVFGEWDSYLKWCQQHELQVEPDAFPPRTKFGPYLKDKIKSLLEQAQRNNITVVMKSLCKVVKIEHSHDLRNICTIHYIESDSAHTIDVNGVFLCTGAASNNAQTYSHLLPTPKYLTSPWPCNVANNVSPEDTVAVIGTGLTGVDAVKQLHAQAHQGKVVFTSRTGRLPAIKANAPGPFFFPRIATIAAVNKLSTAAGDDNNESLVESYVQLVVEELVLYHVSNRPASEQGDTEYETRLRRQITRCMSNDPTQCDGQAELSRNLMHNRTAAEGRILWHECLFGIMVGGVVPHMWNTLGAAGKTYFKHRYATVYQIHSNAMPACSGLDIQAYLSDGWCELRGGLQNVEYLSECGKYRLYYPQGVTVEVDRVINATGVGLQYRTREEIGSGSSSEVIDLYADLLASGMATRNAFGGLNCDFATQRILSAGSAATGVVVGTEVDASVSGSSAPLIYGVGHVVSGAKLFSSGLGYCTLGALVTVKDMLQRLEESKQ